MLACTKQLMSSRALLAESRQQNEQNIYFLRGV